MTGAESLSAEDKSELIQYLHQHGIDYQLFKQVLAGTAPNRYFIPFPKVIQFYMFINRTK